MREVQSHDYTLRRNVLKAILTDFPWESYELASARKTSTLRCYEVPLGSLLLKLPSRYQVPERTKHIE